jgi:hypothetical protein
VKLIIKPAARRDILSQAAYLAEHGGNELGLRFVVCVEESLRRLCGLSGCRSAKGFQRSFLGRIAVMAHREFSKISGTITLQAIAAS